MSKNKLIIAAAGAGKTTYLVKQALIKSESEILITTFTLANEAEIKKKMVELYGCIPKNVTIQTWFSFLLQHGVKPYQGSLYENKIKGMMLVSERSGVKYTTSQKKKKYYGENEFKNYYFNKNGEIYSDKIAKFMVKSNDKSHGAVIKRINKIYTDIFIDEVQDLVGYDLEIIKLLLQSQSAILLVGDPRQVTYSTHRGIKYSKYSNGKIMEFIQNECKKIECEIDQNSLKYSRRNNQQICDYSSKLYPQFEICLSKQHEVTRHDGIFLVRKRDINMYLQEFQAVQLRYNSRTQVNNDFKVLNFGESKGLTFDRVLIYPTNPITKWIKDSRCVLQPESLAKFYVALTRAKYSVAIVYEFDDETHFEGMQNFKLKI
ncbi:UvrD-helicase domain-containing protein [Paenibacillus wulumuqiensis]|uniref:UvrD-helicase domain-containing protein n=1 Tax=Paenibacillus wulumuqiensis TaxID=1567107 RepID=UPI0006191EAB|nr:UvrD-helicase domain-containing protein [Paenibacillus wulumuqiensis]